MKFTSVLFALLLISTIPIVSSTGYQVPTISGPQSTLVLPVFFADVGNSTSIQTVQSRVFDDLSAYLQNVSYGNVSITGRVAPKWYKLPYSMSYYGSGFDKLNELIAHSVRAADPDVNYREYAYLIIVHAGDDSDRSGKPNDVKSSASLGAYGPLYTGEGTVALSVSIVAEKDPLGVYAHWFLRSSGLTELWHYGIYESVPEDDFMGEWCVMAHGFWGNNGSTPAHPCSWSKMKLGWIPPSQVLDLSLIHISEPTRPY